MQRSEDIWRASDYRIDGGRAKEVADHRGVIPENMEGPS
jgi:hypothetical protein